MRARALSVLPSAIAAAVTAVASLAVRPFGLRGEATGDMGVFWRYARAVGEGRVPYRDFALEYPPGALGAIVPPGVGRPTESVYATRFAVGAIVVLAVLAVAVLATVTLLERRRVDRVVGVALVALAPVLLGSIVLRRFDVLPTLLTVVALRLALGGRFAAAGAALGLATPVKLYPAVLLPVLLAAAGRRAAARAAASFAVAAAVVVVPFVALSPGGVADAVRAQLGRHVQIESTAASLALLAHAAGGFDIGLIPEQHSWALGGTRAAVLGAASTVALAAALATVWIAATRAAATRDGLVVAWTAAVAAVVAFTRVLSPQYVIWLLPLVAVIGGRLGRAAAAVLAAALVLTNVWFPTRYDEVVARLDAGATVVLVARNALLVALFALLAAAVVSRARQALTSRSPGRAPRARRVAS